MTESRQFLISTVLLLLIAGLVLYLTWDVRRTRREVLAHGETASGPDEIAPSSRQFLAHAVFEEKDLFRPIVTAVPTHTPVLAPTPTPAPPPIPCENWQIRMILGPVVQVVDGYGTSHYLREGQILEGIRISGVNQKSESVLVENLADGRQMRLRLGQH